MGKVALRLDHLKHLDGGKVDAAWADALKRATLDCEDRPSDPTPRMVTLKAKVVPISHERDLDACRVEFEVCVKVPDRRSKPFMMNAHANGQLSFVEENPDNPAQSTLLDQEPDRP